MKKYLVEYNHNNSGGRDWVTQDKFRELLSRGWRISCGDEDFIYSVEKVFEAKSERRALNTAIDEWREITRQNENDQGCECCGPPHYFSVDALRNRS